MKFILILATLIMLATVRGDKDAKDSQLSMVLVRALQSQLKTCMDQNRNLVQRSCQKPGHWGGNGESPMKKRAFAFHAELRGNIQNIPHNHKVVFNFAHLNEGGAYDPKSGIFTCKEPGIYMFHWTILTRRGYRFQSDLMVNGVIHGRLALVAEAINDNRAGSSMVVVKLKPGNKVWVEPHSTEVGKYAVGGWSFFSGFKI